VGQDRGYGMSLGIVGGLLRKPAGGAVGVGDLVPAYYNVQALIDAAAGGLVAGYYSALPIGVLYWDGAAFSREIGGAAVELSPVMDHLADVKFWFSNQGRVTLGSLPAGVGAAAYYWLSHDATNPVVARPNGVVVQSINGRPACGQGQTPTSLLMGIDGPFEVFAAINLNTTQSNKGILGTWTGAGGVIFSPAHFTGSFGPSIGFGGVYAVSPDRIDGSGGAPITPHVVSARYTGAELIITVDGVDKATTAKTGVMAATTTGVVLGAYDLNVLTNMNGNYADIIWINKALTVDERAAIVTDLMTKIGI
jgi:hypothetical protein